MQAYLRDRALIPEGNLVEVRFEDLEQAPVEQLRRVYGRLGLPGFAEAEPAFRAYLDAMAGCQKNEYQLDAAAIGKVNRHWGFALGEWGYALR